MAASVLRSTMRVPSSRMTRGLMRSIAAMHSGELTEGTSIRSQYSGQRASSRWRSRISSMRACEPYWSRRARPMNAIWPATCVAPRRLTRPRSRVERATGCSTTIFMSGNADASLRAAMRPRSLPLVRKSTSLDKVKRCSAGMRRSAESSPSDGSVRSSVSQSSTSAPRRNLMTYCATAVHTGAITFLITTAPPCGRADEGSRGIDAPESVGERRRGAGHQDLEMASLLELAIERDARQRHHLLAVLGKQDARARGHRGPVADLGGEAELAHAHDVATAVRIGEVGDLAVERSLDGRAAARELVARTRIALLGEH